MKLPYIFTAMTASSAREIVATWTYPGDYAIYNYALEADHMLAAENWGQGLFEVRDSDGMLVGELSFGFLDADDEWIEPEDWNETGLQDAVLWVGFGLRPDLTGQGYGAEFVRACTAFALERARACGYHGQWVGLGVAWFNQRAVKTYQRAGFEVFARGHGPINGREFETVRMRKPAA